MSEVLPCTQTTIRNFQMVGTVSRSAASVVKGCLAPAPLRPVTLAELEQIAKASKGRKKGGDDA